MWRESLVLWVFERLFFERSESLAGSGLGLVKDEHKSENVVDDEQTVVKREAPIITYIPNTNTKTRTH